MQELPLDDIQDFVEAFQTVQAHYADPLSDRELFENAKAGLASQLDAYSRYLDDTRYQQLLKFTQGRLAEPSLSLRFDEAARAWRVASVASRSSAYQAGLRVGVTVDRIDGVNLARLDERAIRSLLMGQLGSLVSVRARLQAHDQTIEVLRDQPMDDQVRSLQLADDVLVLQIGAFQEKTVQQVQTALATAQQQGPIQAILLDLRNNPGGLLAAAVDLADLFLQDGLIVTIKGRTAPVQQFRAMPDQSMIRYPVAILQNRFTASAAEVFTAAMQEQRRALVVGETSYGKGAIQQLFPLRQGALQLTVAYYYTPQGHLLENRGVIPDILLQRDQLTSDEQQLQAARQALVGRLTVSRPPTTSPNTVTVTPRPVAVVP